MKSIYSKEYKAVIERLKKARLESGLKQEEVAKKVGKNRSTVTNMLRVLSLPDKIKQSLRKQEITVGHARALLAISDASKQIESWKQIVKNSLNVRDVEVLVSGREEKPRIKKGGRKRVYTQNAELNALVEKLTTHMGTKVKIFGTQDRGRIEINYYSKEDLERILDMIMPQQKEVFISAN